MAEQQRRMARPGEALSAMYVVAVLVMGIALVVIVALIFVPRDFSFSRNTEDVYVPGAAGAGAFDENAAAAFRAPPAGVREVAPGRYEAVIEAVNWEFRPKEIRVPVGSEVTFRAHSLEDYHGIALIGTPVLLSLKQNELAEATHIFTEPGEYLWVCSEYCGAGHTGMTGMVIVE